MPSRQERRKLRFHLVIALLLLVSGMLIAYFGRHFYGQLPGGMFIGTGGIMVFKASLQLRRFMKRDKRIRRALTREAENLILLMTALDDGKGAVYALYCVNDKVNWSLVDVADKGNYAKLKEEGQLVPLNSVYARADGGIVKLMTRVD